jgi:hypothetical protein
MAHLEITCYTCNKRSQYAAGCPTSLLTPVHCTCCSRHAPKAAITTVDDEEVNFAF